MPRSGSRHAHFVRLRTWIAGALAALVCLLSMVSLAGTPAAAAEAVLQRGDSAVTGFSGVKTEPNVPDDVHPLDRTFIDLEGPALKIFSLSDLGTAPRGQVADAPTLRTFTAAQLGQVFGITLAGTEAASAPDIYVAATSLYGLQIVAENGKGGVDRLLNGAKGARFMDGQFGPGGSPGSIYKIDGTTGAASLFADVRFEGRVNSGPGLGNLAYDPKTRQIFVSDLETGLIHRITLDGKERDTFDHGDIGRKAQGLDVVAYDPERRMSIESPAFDSEETATWGFADERRRVFGLGVLGGRLYYAVAEGPAVWSVSIDEEGDFGTDARIELEVKDTPAGTNITSIAFDGAGMMYLAQRGAPSGSYDYAAFAAPEQARLLRYRWDDKEGRWSEAFEDYAVGLSPDHRSTLGGVALNYGYDKFGRIDLGACRQTVWTTGEHLREGEDIARVSIGGAKTVHGLQGMYKARVRPQNVPPYESWFVDYNGLEDDPATFGQVGALAIYAPCAGAVEPAGTPRVTPEIIGLDPPLDDPGFLIDKRCFGAAPGGKVRCKIEVRNLMDAAPSSDVVLEDLTRTLVGPSAGALVPVVAVTVPNPLITCTATPTPNFTCTIPAALLVPGETILIEVFVDTHDLTLGGNVGFRNCAKIHHAQGHVKACAEGGTDIVVEKIGPGTCDAGGACKFGLRIANVGAMPFEGDVLLADAMFIGGGTPSVPVVSVAPPIACTAGDTAQLPFTCQTHLSLMPGEDHIHWIEVTMPAPGGYEAENCFGALDPALIAVGPVPPGLIAAGTGNPSCVIVDVPAQKISPVQADPPRDPVPPPTLIKLPRCDDGRLRRADGSCPCPQGTAWNTREAACVPLRPRCLDPDRRKDDGTCCPRGSYYDAESGRCRTPDPVCPDPERRRDDGSCCPRGTVVSENGARCVGIDVVCPAGTRWHDQLDTCLPLRPMCDWGERYDWRLQMCRPVGEHCPRGTRFNRHTRECEEGGQACPEGTHWSRRRQGCVPDETRTPCPDGSPRLANGSCRCPLNRRWNELSQSCGDSGHPPRVCKDGERWLNGRCVKGGDAGGDPEGKPCPAGQHRVGRICVPIRTDDKDCPQGQHRVGKLCLPDRTTTDQPCPAGQHRVGNVCVPKEPEKVECPAGRHRVRGICVGGEPPPLMPCPAGQHRVGKICVPDRVVRPPTGMVCSDSQIKVGNRCLPRNVIKVPPKGDPVEPKRKKPDIPKVLPKIDLPKVKVIKPDVPKVRIKPETPRIRTETPRIKIKPDTPKFVPKFTPKADGGGQGKVQMNKGNGGGGGAGIKPSLQLKLP